MRLFPIVILPLLAGCLLYPSHHPIRTDAERFTLAGVDGPVAGRELELFYRELGPDGPVELYVLALTGNAGRAERMAGRTGGIVRAAEEAGEVRIGVAALQHPGFGADRGGASVRASGQAAVEALAWLRERAGDRPIWIHGLSLGSAFALYAARQAGPEQVAGLILEKPPNLRTLILGRFGWWNLWLIAGPYALFLPSSVLSSCNAAAIEGIPAVGVIATHDQVVPEWSSLDVLEVYAGPLRTVYVQSGHNASLHPGNCRELPEALGWLWRKTFPGP